MKPVDMAAAVGVAQLKKLPGFIALRRRNFKRLYDELKKYEEYLILPQATKESRPSWFGFLIGVKTTAPFTKDQLVAHLEKNCIATRPLFAGNILRHPAFEGMRHRVNGGLKNTDFVMNRVFWIGVYPGLDDKMIRYIHEAFSVFMAPFNKG
jgi:CDP-6-deoxy-D-xylo-4-hexulose-3-dehydrase